MRTSVMYIDCKIATLEDKEELTEKERQLIPRMLKKLEEIKAEFKTYHHAIVEQIEEEQDLTKEQTTLDEFEKKIRRIN